MVEVGQRYPCSPNIQGREAGHLPAIYHYHYIQMIPGKGLAEDMDNGRIRPNGLFFEHRMNAVDDLWWVVEDALYPQG